MATEVPTWAGMTPVFALLVLVLVLPGWLVVRALGAHGVQALAIAPAVSAGLIATTATLLQRAGVSWGWLPLVVTTAVTALAAGVLGVVVRSVVERRRPRAECRQEPYGRLHVAAAVAVGAVVAVVMIAPAIGRPDELVDSPDAVYHLDRIRLFLDTGNFSIVNHTFYPNGFHAWVATALQSGAAGVVAGTNIATIVLAALVWPLGCVTLARQLLGNSRLVTYASGFASAALVAFPTLLLGWGVLWPNLMGTALTPGVLAAMVAAVRTRRVASALALAASLPGLALVQPNALVAIGVFAVAWFVGARLQAGALHQTRWAVVFRDLGIAAVVLSVGLYVAPRLSTTLASTQSFVWKDHVGIEAALVEELGGSLLTGSVLWGPVLLLPLGIAWIVTRVRPAVPVVAMWALSVALYVTAASSTTPWTSLLTGYWYNDKVRLASLAAVPGVVIITAAAPALHHLLRRLRLPGERRHAASLIATLVVPLLTVGWGFGVRQDTVAAFYRPADPTHVILGDQGRADLAVLGALIPPGEGVVGRPENGTPLMYALFGTNTLYRSIPIPTSGDEILIGTGFDQLSTRPDVCAALARHHIRWAIDSTHVYWLDRPERSSGLVDLAHVEGLRPISTKGDYQLFMISGCTGPNSG